VESQRPAERQRPRLIVPEHARAPSQLDLQTRECHERRITWLARRFGLQWLVDQALLTCGSIEELPESALLALAADFDRALRCLEDNVSFVDAGLVRSWA
jgi:hypothetical protein